MTPKEKAIELSIKFDKYGETDNAKQCALIAVDEIIKAIDFDWMEIQNLENEHRYWEQVKTEIQNL